MPAFQVSYSLKQTVIADTPEEAALVIANALVDMNCATILVDGKAHHVTAASFACAEGWEDAQ